MVGILTNYIKKLVRINVLEGETIVPWVGRLSYCSLEDELIVLYPGTTYGPILNLKDALELVRQCERKEKPSIYPNALETGRVLINKTRISTIEELVEE